MWSESRETQGEVKGTDACGCSKNNSLVHVVWPADLANSPTLPAVAAVLHTFLDSVNQKSSFLLCRSNPVDPVFRTRKQELQELLTAGV